MSHSSIIFSCKIKDLQSHDGKIIFHILQTFSFLFLQGFLLTWYNRIIVFNQENNFSNVQFLSFQNINFFSLSSKTMFKLYEIKFFACHKYHKITQNNSK